MTPEEARNPNRRTSFHVLNLRDVRDGPSRQRFLERQLRRFIARYRPTLVALGILDQYKTVLRESHEFVKQVLDCHGIPLVEQSLSHLFRILLDEQHTKHQDLLPETIARQFFPDLPVRRRATERRRYEENAWNALALALVTLAEHRPLSALALTQPKCVLSAGFSNLLAQADHSL